MTATAADYAWFEDQLPGLSEAYCLTLARGLQPQEFLARIGATERAPLTGVSAIFEPSLEAWNAYDGTALLIAATAVPGDTGEWTLGVESNGFLGVTPAVIVPASAGTQIVSHFQNIEGVTRFYWIEDGDVRLLFSPLDPADREGSTPDAVTDIMRQVGFDLDEDSDNADHCVAAALALAEHLTGVRLTPELLERATYLCGIAPTRPG
jgi:hypothetical protein